MLIRSIVNGQKLSLGTTIVTAFFFSTLQVTRHTRFVSWRPPQQEALLLFLFGQQLTVQQTKIPQQQPYTKIGSTTTKLVAVLSACPSHHFLENFHLVQMEYPTT